MESLKKINRKDRKLKKAQALLALLKDSKQYNNNKKEDTKTSTSASLTSSSSSTVVVTTSPSNPGRMEEAIGENTPVSKSKESPDKAGDATPNSESKSKNGRMSSDDFIEMKRLLRERNKIIMDSPKIFLTPEEMLPYKAIDDSVKIDVPPIYAFDVQNLLLFALQGNACSFKPRWCKLLRVGKISSVVAIFLDGVSYSDFVEDKESFKFIHQTFKTHVEMVCPESYGSTVTDEIMSVPLSISQIKKANVKVRDDIRKQVAAKIVPRKIQPTENCVPNPDKFSRVCLLMSTHQMKHDGYPLPVETANEMYKGFVFSQDHYAEVTAESPLFALDCEMCITNIHKHELTRISVINEMGEVLYDTLVKPRNPITNYVTRYSGITKEMLENITVRLEDVQAELKRILPSDAILCGQSLNCDLLAIKMFHPYVIDTSVIFNMSGDKGTKAGLRKLTGFFLNRSIQDNVKGHSSVEDARATLDLVKLKLQKGLEFGDATVNGKYFPNIHSYFLGNKLQCDAQTENLQQSVLDAGDPIVKPDETNTTPQVNSKRPCLFTNDRPVKRKKTLSSQAMRIFNQDNGVYVHQSFFKLLEESGRASCFIGMKDVTSKYEKEPIEKVTVSSDKEACTAAKNAVEKKEFTWVNFQKCRYSLDDKEYSKEYDERVRFKLDSRVEKVLSKVKEKSLVVVIMTGRHTEDGVSKGGIFVKIT